MAKLIFRRSRSPRPSGWTIGEAAERLQALGLQVSTSQIRKLEREGLLETPARTAGNYRVLDDASLEVIKKRLVIYGKETRPVLDYYGLHLVHPIDSTQTPVNVLRDILRVIAKI